MYQYDEYDATLVAERVAEFRDQVGRRLSGELSEEEFLPLRLQNGLYMQKHARGRKGAACVCRWWPGPHANTQLPDPRRPALGAPADL